MASRSGSRSVARWVAGGVVCVLVVALSGLSGAVPAVALSRSGHWLYSITLGAVFHIDGGSDSVDAKTPAPGLSPAESVVTDGKRIYVTDRKNGRVITFGKSDLRQQTTTDVGTHEKGIVLQVTGGPYLVFPKKGKIVRYGAHPVVVNTGSELSSPMATTDGTLWVRRLDTDRICKLKPSANSLTCGMTVPKGHEVQLVALDDQPSLIDLSSGQVSRLDADGKDQAGSKVQDIPRSGRVSATDAGGRLPIVTGDTKHPQLRLVDTSTVGSGRNGRGAIPVNLTPGDYDAPTTAGSTTVLVNQTTHTITTYDVQGHPLHTQVATGETQPLRMYRGEDGRVYVDNTAGTKSFRVAGDGSIKPIDVAHPGPGNGPALPPKKSTRPTTGPKPSSSAKPTAKPSSSAGGSSGSTSDAPTESTSGTSGASTPPSSASRSSRTPTRVPGITGLPTIGKSRGKSSSASTEPTRSKGNDGDKTQKPKKNNGGNGNGSSSKPRQQNPQQPNPQPPANGGGDDSGAPVGNGGNGNNNNNGGGQNTPTAPPAEKPDAPASVNVTAKVKVADVTWTKPSNNGAKITGYKVTWKGGSRTVKGTSIHITGLTAQTQYTVSVAARNKVGLGKAASRTFTTKKAPVPPFQFAAQAKANADGSVTVNWNAYPGALTYAVTRIQNGETKQLTGQDGYYQTSFTTTDVTPGQPVSFSVLAYKLLVQFGTATTNQVTPKQPGGGNNGGGNNNGTPPNGATQVNGLDWVDKGGGNINFCWSKPDYLGEDNAELTGYRLSVEGGETRDVGPDESDATMQVPNRGHNRIDVQAITRVPGWPDPIYGMHSYTEGESNFVEIVQPIAPEVVLNKVTLGADHVLVVDMHLHDHGSPTRLSVLVDEKIVFGPELHAGGDQVLRIPNVVVQKGKTVDVQVGSSSEGGTGNVAKAKVTAQ